MSKLEEYLNKPVRDLVAPVPATISDEEKERHQIYALLLMAITRFYWNGRKEPRKGAYPLNPSEAKGDIGNYFDKDYLGHNIAGLAVDADGLVIDFEFNHNEVFNSSAEHAEARLIRRVFSLSQVHDSWNLTGEKIPPKHYANMLTSVRVYTTLESCSQCSGIMALGLVKEVVYLQTDPGMYFIGNILRRLTEGTPLQAPLPIAASAIGVPYFEQLDKAYQDFAKQQDSKMGEPFFKPDGGHDKFTNSITSFLCTRAAYAIYAAAEKEFDKLDPATLTHAAYKPAATALSNGEALAEAKSFREYAIRKGRRGTPHK